MTVFEIGYYQAIMCDLSFIQQQHNDTTLADNADANTNTTPPTPTMDYNPYLLSKIQNYNPVYNELFELTKQNYNRIVLNQKYQFVNLNTVIHLPTKTTKTNVPIFIKFSPLLDTIHYFIGKYENDPYIENPILPTFPPTPTGCNSSCLDKIENYHNASYIDNLFCYFNSSLLNHYGFFNGVDYYGSFLAIQDEFKVNITDDLDYLLESKYFTKNINKLFRVVYKNDDSNQYDDDACGDGEGGKGGVYNIHNHSQKHLFKNKLVIKEGVEGAEGDAGANGDAIVLLFDEIETIADADTNDETATDYSDEIEEIYKNSKHDHQLEDYLSSTSSTDTSSIVCSTEDDFKQNKNSCCGAGGGHDGARCCAVESGDGDDTDIEDDDDVGCGGGGVELNIENDANADDEDTEYEDEDDENEPETFAYIRHFPTQMICLEKCEDTLDSLFMNNEMDDEQGASMFFQVIFILLTWQKTFQMTHNDLHTNNIMYITTKHKFLYYQYAGCHYKVPTYGKIYKIIDFGRSIFTYQGKIFCSDSYQRQGDAYSQYNCPPFFNEKKPLLEPNRSFDLCRLGCSMYDYIDNRGDDNGEGGDDAQPQPPQLNPKLKETIQRWCMDDYGKNILYKSNGDERYPSFKLYKMIARTAHNHTPEAQLEFPYFKQFLLSHPPTQKEYKKSLFFNLDAIDSFI